MVGDRVLACQADDARRNGRDEHEPSDALVRRLDPACADGAEPRADESHDVGPEIGTHGDERPQVKRDIERLVEPVVLLEVRPVRRPGNEDEVPRRGDRQELGQPLDDPEDEGLPVRQRGGVVPRSEQREHDGEPERGPRDAEDDGAAHGDDPMHPCTRKPPEENGRKLRQSGEQRA